MGSTAHFQYKFSLSVHIVTPSPADGGKHIANDLWTTDHEANLVFHVTPVQEAEAYTVISMPGWLR